MRKWQCHRKDMGLLGSQRSQRQDSAQGVLSVCMFVSDTMGSCRNWSFMM